MSTAVIKDAYGFKDNNPSAIYMALAFDTDALEAVTTKYGEKVLHERGLSKLSLANEWDDPRMDVTGKLGELIGLLISVGADRDPKVNEYLEVARQELHKRAP